MMTQTHLLVASGLFARPDHTLRNFAILFGALIPDAAIYVLFGWSKIQGIPERTVWRELYWQEPWQSWTAAGNSLPIYMALLVIGLVLLRNAAFAWKIGLVLAFMALAAVTHIAGDLPVHVDDAHRHFWPLSNWKFISPVSYWHPDHHGGTFAIFEVCLGLLLAILLFRRFKTLWVRSVLGLFVAAYVAVPIYFTYQMGSA